jgi:uncharacterized protein (DUF952 family)
MPQPVYKILSEAAFAAALREGRFAGSADDLRDGFIHLSAAHQLAGTLEAHFARQDGLLLIALDAERLAPDLKWEPSRGGALFPHLYAPVDLEAVLSVERVELDRDGRHILPEGVAA